MNVLFSRLLMQSMSISIVFFVAGDYSFAGERAMSDRHSLTQVDLPSHTLSQTPEILPTPANPGLNRTTEEIKPAIIINPAAKATDRIEQVPAKTPEVKPAELPNPTATPAPEDQPIVSPRPTVAPTPSKPSNNPAKPDLEPKSTPQERSTDPNIAAKVARSIAVKITAPELIGTGTLVGDENGVYTIITNAHVIRVGKAPYKIMTADRKIHQAQIVPNPKFKQYDLAILQFRAPAGKYPVGKLGKSESLQVGDRLFVGGFTKQTKQRDRDDYLLQTGAISLILKSPMDETGYKIGYTHRIYRGMSGGPVIDSAGRLVGINGMLGDPIWKTITKFADGSSACEPLQNAIDRSAFAIAIDDITTLTPDAKWWQQEASSSTPKIEKTSTAQKEIAVLQQSAANALSCQ